MAEIFEERDLHLVAGLPVVQVIDHVVATAKPDQVEIEFVAHGTEDVDQILEQLDESEGEK